MTYKILDISKYQPNVDYTKVAKAVDGVILRVGLTYWGKQNMGKDECFDKHYAGFKKAGLPVGAYYYSCADSVAMAEKEAEYCLSLLKGKQFELPVYYDVENTQRQGSLSKAALTQIVDAFCKKVEAAGYFVGFYASTSWLKNKMNTADLSKKYTLWKADYRLLHDKTIVCDMHQFTSEGSVEGIKGNVDMSNCYVDFVSAIKNKGLNGFAPQGVNPVEPVREAMRLIIGPMSKGDRLTFGNLLNDMQIKYESNTEGYIITQHTVTGDDIAKIEAEAEKVGNISVKEYVADVTKPEQCAECDLLEAEIEQLKAQLKAKEAELAAEHDAKVYVQEQLDVANKALAAEKAINSSYSKENAQLTEKLAKIKEIVGG